MDKNVAVIILAAGKSTRMKSALPKVLHPICGRPMLGFVLDLVKDLKKVRSSSLDLVRLRSPQVARDKKFEVRSVVAVLGYRHQEVRKHLGPDIKVAIQKRLLGTADAVKTGLRALKNFKGTVLILYADNPLLKKETISSLLKFHTQNQLSATLLTAQLDNPSGYGRILRDKYSTICGIVEEKDADDFQKEIKEINTGIICFAKDSLSRAINKIRPNNKKKEYYLTDIIEIFYKQARLVDAVKLLDINEALGINTRSDLSCANKIMQARINEGLMHKGVTIIDPASTFISYGAKIGQDTTIYPFTVIESGVKIGKSCFLGPFLHLRQGTRIKDNVIAGNFLEVVRSDISSGTFAKHFCYLGDSRIGPNVNIGAGTVTANFDGRAKHLTTIKAQAQIGSDTVIVAPVKIGKGAKTGAGSVILKDVPDGATVVGVPAKILRSNEISLASKSK